MVSDVRIVEDVCCLCPISQSLLLNLILGPPRMLVPMAASQYKKMLDVYSGSTDLRKGIMVFDTSCSTYDCRKEDSCRRLICEAVFAPPACVV